MLFHVTLTHTPADCPGYSPEKMPPIIDFIENAEARAKELNVKVHFMVSGAPEHVSFALLEADSPGPVAMFVMGIPMRQDSKVTAVMHEKDMAATARELMARRGGAR